MIFLSALQTHFTHTFRTKFHSKTRPKNQDRIVRISISFLFFFFHFQAFHPLTISTLTAADLSCVHKEPLSWEPLTELDGDANFTQPFASLYTFRPLQFKGKKSTAPLQISANTEIILGKMEWNHHISGAKDTHICSRSNPLMYSRLNVI